MSYQKSLSKLEGLFTLNYIIKAQRVSRGTKYAFTFFGRGLTKFKEYK